MAHEAVRDSIRVYKIEKLLIIKNMPIRHRGPQAASEGLRMPSPENTSNPEFVDPEDMKRAALTYGVDESRDPEVDEMREESGIEFDDSGGELPPVD